MRPRGGRPPWAARRPGRPARPGHARAAPSSRRRRRRMPPRGRRPPRAAAAWESEYNRDGEDRDAAHALVLGGTAAFDDLLAPSAGAGRVRSGWDEGEPTRFGRLAMPPLERAPGARAAGRTGERGDRPALRRRAARCRWADLLEASAGTGKTHTIAPSWRATWPRACRWTSCSWSPSPAPPPASCASACACGWSRPRRPGGRPRPAWPPGTTRCWRCCAGTPGGAAAGAAASRRALADFDAATITTTHGFCQQVLGGARRRRRRRPRRGLRRGPRRSRRARWSTTSTCAASTPRAAAAVRPRPWRSAIGRVAVGHPGAPLEPRDAAQTRPRRACRLAEASATSSTGASGALRVMTYDDLLTRLRGRARRPGRRRGRRAAARALPAWCWSTSSRTPTRCSGRSCAARSPTGPRSC